MKNGASTKGQWINQNPLNNISRLLLILICVAGAAYAAAGDPSFTGRITELNKTRREKRKTSRQIFSGVPTEVTIDQETGNYIIKPMATGYRSEQVLDSYFFQDLAEFLSGAESIHTDPDPFKAPYPFTVEKITLVPDPSSHLPEVSYRPGRVPSDKVLATLLAYRAYHSKSNAILAQEHSDWKYSDRLKRETPVIKKQHTCEITLGGFGHGRGLSGDPGWWQRWMSWTKK